MKRVLAAAFVVLACVYAHAQEAVESRSVPDAVPASAPGVGASTEASRLLKSRENRERAWGAYLAGRHGLKELSPLLVEALAELAPDTGWEEGHARQVVLDGLIRLGAEVPAERLMPLYQSSPNEVIILLAQTPKENAAALSSIFVEEMPSAHWLAVGNLLAEERAAGFAALLLRDLKVEASVHVSEREGPHDIFFGGGCGCGCGGGPPLAPEGFPPVYYYTLTDYAKRGAVVVAPGRRPAFYARARTPGTCPGLCSESLDRDSLRAEYLAGLLNVGADYLGLDVRPHREVVCKDARQCRRALAGVRDEIERAYAGLLERLVAESLLDAADAAALRPDLTFNLYDHRADRSWPLPRTLKGVKLNVE